jgi:hypothetical protein
MRVNVAGQQQRLKEQQADRPNGRAASKLRQNVLAYERLNMKKEQRAEKDRSGITDRQSRCAFLRVHTLLS